VAYTCQSVLDLARHDLNDDAKIRYTDADMIKHLNDAIALAYSLRPDLRYGNYATAYTDLSVSNDCPLPIEYRAALADYVVDGMQSSDDEFINDKRAEKSLKEYFAGIGGPRR